MEPISPELSPTLVDESLESSTLTLLDCYVSTKADTLYDLKYRGDDLFRAGRYLESEPVFATILERILEDEYAGADLVRFAKEDLATSCVFAGHFDRAEELFREVLLQEEKSANNDFALHRAYHNMGNLFCDRGQYQHGEFYYQQALSWRTRELGKHDFDTLCTLMGLAMVKARDACYLDAERLLGEVICGYQRLAPDHPYNIVARHCQGVIFGLQENRQLEAETLLRWATDRTFYTYGAHHPFCLAAVHNLAFCLYRQGKHEEASLLGRQALDGRVLMLGEEHFLTKETAKNLALSLSAEGFDEQAVELRVHFSVV